MLSTLFAVLLDGAFASPLAPADPEVASVRPQLHWFREHELTVGGGLVVGDLADRAAFEARLGAGVRFTRGFGVEMVATVAERRIGFTPGVTMRVPVGPIDLVASGGVGIGVFDHLGRCRPLNGTVDCGWKRLMPSMSAPEVALLTRASAGVRVEQSGWLVVPQLDAYHWATDEGPGVQGGLTVGIGRVRTREVAPRYVVRRHLDEERRRRAFVAWAIDSPVRDVAVEAWHMVLDLYLDAQTDAARAAAEPYLFDALETGSFSQREAARVYASHGERVAPLVPALWGRSMDCGEAVRAMVRITKREGSAALEGVEALPEGDTTSCIERHAAELDAFAAEHGL